jgi:hypothetical protein
MNLRRKMEKSGEQKTQTVLRQLLDACLRLNIKVMDISLNTKQGKKIACLQCPSLTAYSRLWTASALKEDMIIALEALTILSS